MAQTGHDTDTPAPHGDPDSTGRPHPTAALGKVSLSWSDHDQMRWMTVAVTLGTMVAAVLAVIGNTPFDMPMPSHAIGWVTPTCGLTRGSTALARGDLALAWAFNPASVLVAVFAVLGVSRAVWGWGTGRWLTIAIRPSRAGWTVLGACVLLLWVNQQAHVDFVVHARL